MSKFKFVQWYGIVVCLLMAACTDVDITMPKGPKGDTGLSAYEFWKEKVADGTVDWPKDQTEVADFFKYLKGNDGKDGKDGKSAFDQWKDMIADGSVDNPHNPGSKWPAGNNTVQDFWYFLTGATGESGQTPHIGDNGHWFVGNEDTGIAAQGEAGKDGANGKDAVPPTVTIGDNDHWFVNGVDTGKKATGTNGKDGVSPTITIGNNGNWFVDGTDTGKKAVGADGKSPEVAIGENGNWYINGTDTGKPSFGKAGKDGTNGTNGTNGANGTNGKSAYELWKEYIASGEVDNPHKPDQKWPADRNKQTDFWDFLTGRSSVIEIQVGKYNVIPDYWNSQLREYVIPTDGSVLFTVYDKTGKKVAAGVQVSGLPGVGATETFTTDDNGQFKVAWDKLPDNQPLSRRTGSATVTVGGVQETSAKNTLVPNRINVRATVSMVYLSNASSDINATRYAYVSFKYERQIDGEWSDYPNSLNSSMMRAAKIKDINQPVNEENLDKSKNSTYTYGSTYIDIRRPLVLTPTEKANVAKNDTVQRLLSDEWDGNDFYAGLYFGDGSGSYNDYGQTVYLQDKIHIPEIYPTPGFKEGAVFLEIKQGVTTLWGEIDTDQLPDFYKTYAYPSGQDRFTKDPDTGIWKFPEGKLPASDLAKNRAVFIQMRTFVNGTGGTVHTGTVPLSFGAGVNAWLSNSFGLGLQGEYLLPVQKNLPHFVQVSARVIWRIGGKSKKQAPVVKYVEIEKPVEVEKIVERIVEKQADTAGSVEAMACDLLDNIYFEFDKDVLTAASEKTLDRLAGLLKSYPDARFLITGYTDARGSSAYNTDLSNRRAKRVYEALLERGVPAAMLKWHGIGKRASIIPVAAGNSVREGDRKVLLERITNMKYWEAL